MFSSKRVKSQEITYICEATIINENLIRFLTIYNKNFNGDILNFKLIQRRCIRIQDYKSPCINRPHKALHSGFSLLCKFHKEATFQLLRLTCDYPPVKDISVSMHIRLVIGFASSCHHHHTEEDKLIKGVGHWSDREVKKIKINP